MQRVICTSCNNEGVVSIANLPRSLTCSQCGASRHVEPDRRARIESPAVRDEWINKLLADAR
jgi:hypothetical protein